jgi:hypothetical protein
MLSIRFLYCPDFSGLAQIFTPIWNKELIDQTVCFVMASFLNSTISQVSHVAQAGSLGEIRVGRRTVQIKGKLAEGMQRICTARSNCSALTLFNHLLCRWLWGG